MRRSREPFLWAAFSAGGMGAALLFPALIFVLWVAGPLGWAAPPTHGELATLLSNPIVRFVGFGLLGLAFFHWAHRFRYTLYDGLQLYHLNQLIAIVTYGVATLLTGVTAYVLLIP